MPSVLDDILAADRRRRTEVGPFPLNGNDAAPMRAAREKVAELARKLDAARTTATDDDDAYAAKVEVDLAAAEGALDDLIATKPAFVVELQEVLPPERVDELIAKHPPTADQKKAAAREGTRRLLFNEDTFPPAFLAESMVAIRLGDRRQEDLSATEVTQLWAKLGPADRDLLFAAAWMLRTAPTMVGELGKG